MSSVEPLTSGPVGAAVIAPGLGVRKPSPSATILMVDDERLNSMVVAVYLKAGGYRELVQTTNPRNAIALAKEVHADVVLLDIDMPQLNGIDLLKQIRIDETLANIKAVVLSASDDEQMKEEARTLNAAAFLRKPIHKEELLSTLEAILAPAGS